MAQITVVLYTDSFDPSTRYAQIQEFDGQHLMGEVVLSFDQIAEVIALLTQLQAQETSHAPTH